MCCALLLPASASAQLRLHPLFTDGAVLQREARVPLRGEAAPGARVSVSFGGKPYTTTAGPDGKWRLVLPPMQAGGPYTLHVRAEGEDVRLREVYVGDVWLASGQSNMEWVLRDSRDAAAEIAAANDPQIRHFKVPHLWSYAPVDTLVGGPWRPATPAYAGDFSAVGYFFARALRKYVETPIGLLNASWGGSRIEPWMSAEALDLKPNDIAGLAAEQTRQAEAVRRNLETRLGALPAADRGMVGGKPVWADPDLDASDWQEIAVPAMWETAGYEGMDGVGWYRTTFELTAAEAQAGVRVGLGQIDDSDESYLNGVRIGGMTAAYSVPRVYAAPPGALRAGVNVLVVRAEDTGGGGGIGGSPSELWVEAGGQRRPLAGPWKFKVGSLKPAPTGNYNQIPTLLYNAMIYPLLDFPIKGVIWYQGESNAGDADAYRYRDQFATMIRQWRRDWGGEAFPFLWVQLANFMPADAEPAESGWAVLRESQTATLGLPGTAQAVIIDIGEAGDIHPKNKQDVGARLALAARKVAYGEEDLVYSGPVYRAMRREGGRIVLRFDHVGGGLVARGGAPGGFAVRGAEGPWVWADAAIQGDEIAVGSPRVPDPVAVRYGWGNNPDRVNVYNREGLPMTPFRTDAP